MIYCMVAALEMAVSCDVTYGGNGFVLLLLFFF